MSRKTKKTWKRQFLKLSKKSQTTPKKPKPRTAEKLSTDAPLGVDWLEVVRKVTRKIEKL